jgi:hypothetical protein
MSARSETATAIGTCAAFLVADTPLPDGEYLAFFQAQGFQSRIAAFEINQEADQAVVPVVLQIAMC